jgi:uncharacterized protein DUF3572
VKAAKGVRDDAKQQAAEATAVAALTYLAADQEQLGRFLAVTGIGPDRIREAARHPSFLSGFLDYLVSDEPLLMAFAKDAGLSPGEVGKARQALSGGWERDTP